MVLISRAALEFTLGVSRELYPREFMGLLRGKGDRIKEVLVLPGSVWGEDFSEVYGIHIPMDKSIIGSVHSHPTKDNRPSKTDIREFGRSGRIHLIVAYPYGDIGDIACYDSGGRRLDIESSKGR
jgi:proteasome lid subunit RPN8/RPN11